MKKDEDRAVFFFCFLKPFLVIRSAYWKSWEGGLSPGKIDDSQFPLLQLLWKM